MGWLNKLRKRLEQTKLERYQKEFEQYFSETLQINELDLVHPNLVKRLHVALHPEYMEKVNTAFRLKFPRYSQRQVNEFWRELKRYFILAAVFKQVDMFHEKVDELWHLMLEHKNDYQQFCQAFIGQNIQHIPHTQPTHKPAERTLFDFYYVQLFTVDSLSMKIWHKFFKEDKGLTFMNDFTSYDLASLKQTYMRSLTSEEAEITFEAFTAKIKQAQQGTTLHWKNTYAQTDNASYAYFAYVATDTDDDTDNQDFKDLFGADSNGSTSSHHHDHTDTDSGGSDTSSCSSCSSCSSS